MAYYDPRTDKIVGATPGSYAYAHELRHRWQFKQFPKLEENVTKVHITSYYASIIASIALALLYGGKGVILGVGFGMLPHVLFTAIIELDAYAVGTAAWLWGRLKRGDGSQAAKR